MRKRRNKQQRQKQTYFIIGLLLIVGLAFSVYHAHQTKTVSNSYPVDETVTLTNTAKIYDSLSAIRETNTKFNTASTYKVNRYYLIDKDPHKVYAQIIYNGKNYFVRSTDTNIVMTNAINKYIAQAGYPHADIEHQVSSRFTQQQYGTTSGKPRGVIIHDTGNENSTINSEVSYMEKNYGTTRVFVHTFIDAQQILNIADTKYMAEGAGPNANPYFVQFEMPHEYTATAFANQVANAAYYTAYNLKQGNLPVTKGNKNGGGTVWTHAMVSSYLGGSDHQDAISYWSTSAKKLFDTSYTINDFIVLVQAYYNKM